jgi:hypothetical protein
MLGPRMQIARRLDGLALALCLVGFAVGRDAGAQESNAPNVVAARKHYDKARADYEQGAYREAIAELEAARALDPSAKDLVFNLGVVHEKLGDIDDALQWFRLYATMKLTPQEGDRADAYVRRLEGAKKELEQPKLRRAAPPEPASPGPPGIEPPPPAPAPAPQRARFDALTITTTGVAAAGLVVGVVMGAKALADQPASGFVTGRDGSYADLVHQTDVAHAEAVAADIGFGVAAAAGLASAYLFWSRSRASSAATGATTVSATPLEGGLALVLGGTL